MKTANKQLLRVFAIVTIMPLLTGLIGTTMNFAFSLVFMCSFVEIQQSPLWIFHTLVGIFFTIMLLAGLDD
jgi:hypothetical protein